MGAGFCGGGDQLPKCKKQILELLANQCEYFTRKSIKCKVHILHIICYANTAKKDVLYR